MEAVAERGAQQPLSLRFLDPELERRYQLAAGAESRNGLRVITAASVVLWAMAAVLIPLGTDLTASLATPVSLGMSAISLLAFLSVRWTVTLDQQHAVASVLTAANGLVILWLATVADALPGYGVSAIMLLFAYGFVSRTRFVFAALRTVVIAIGFVIAVATYTGPQSLLIDVFIFVAMVIGTLLALRLLERSRRQVFFQGLVIGEQSEALQREKEKSDRLLLNILPASVFTRLREGEAKIADAYPSVSVLFADLVGFTPLAARLSAEEVVELLNELFARFDDLVAERGLEKIKTVGDAYMAAGGLPEPLDDHALRVVDLGLAMVRATEALRVGDGPLALRVGVHSGPAVGGIIGQRKFAFDVWGDTVNVASRLEAHGVPNRVHVSGATWRLVSERFECESRGSVELKGHGPMETYAIVGPRA